MEHNEIVTKTCETVSKLGENLHLYMMDRDTTFGGMEIAPDDITPLACTIVNTAWKPYMSTTISPQVLCVNSNNTVAFECFNRVFTLQKGDDLWKDTTLALQGLPFIPESTVLLSDRDYMGENRVIYEMPLYKKFDRDNIKHLAQVKVLQFLLFDEIEYVSLNELTEDEVLDFIKDCENNLEMHGKVLETVDELNAIELDFIHKMVSTLHKAQVHLSEYYELTITDHVDISEPGEIDDEALRNVMFDKDDNIILLDTFHIIPDNI